MTPEHLRAAVDALTDAARLGLLYGLSETAPDEMESLLAYIAKRES